jgi:DnaK suppressor protein
MAASRHSKGGTVASLQVCFRKKNQESATKIHIFPAKARPMFVAIYLLHLQREFVKESFEVDHTPKAARLYEEKLLQQKQLLEKSMLSAVEQGRQTSAEDNQDPADHAVFSYQKELLFSQGTNGHLQLNMVREAIRRLNDGSFGECLHCGNEIGAKRLEAVPWSRYCIACQEKVETGEIEDPARAA